jgi:hypothetical protein
MPDKKLLRLIDETGAVLDLDNSVIEKDYYVTKVIHALSDTENDYFRLIFVGGTCLAKAHKIVKRMSEDVDFKIHVKQAAENFSKTRRLKELKAFRRLIKENLMLSNLTIGDPIVRNEGQYSRIEIDYPDAFALEDNSGPAKSGLRSHILLEFTVSEVRLTVESLPIKSLIEDTLGNIKIFPFVQAQCISIEETAIEKWVGLTRRVMAIERGYHDADFFTLAKDIINHDARQFKNQHPEYFTNPVTEIKKSLALLKTKPVWHDRYQAFIENMVYENTADVTYGKAIDALEKLSQSVFDTLQNFKVV